MFFKPYWIRIIAGWKWKADQRLKPEGRPRFLSSLVFVLQITSFAVVNKRKYPKMPLFCLLRRREAENPGKSTSSKYFTCFLFQYHVLKTNQACSRMHKHILFLQKHFMNVWFQHVIPAMAKEKVSLQSHSVSSPHLHRCILQSLQSPIEHIHPLVQRFATNLLWHISVPQMVLMSAMENHISRAD